MRDALEEVESFKRRLELENQYLQEEIKAEVNHRNIVGNSPAVAKLIQQIATVAPTGANVLISGESGTGKADCQGHSCRKWAQRPPGFGSTVPPYREICSKASSVCQGAFTGAMQDRPGRFELAHGGTLFLDSEKFRWSCRASCCAYWISSSSEWGITHSRSGCAGDCGDQS